jgi:hypothetical protein
MLFAGLGELTRIEEAFTGQLCAQIMGRHNLVPLLRRSFIASCHFEDERVM